RAFHVTGVQTCALPIFTAIDATRTPQTRRMRPEGSGWPREVRIESTTVAESAEVTKKMATTTVAATESSVSSGRASNRRKIAVRSEERRVGTESGCRTG